MVCVGSVQGWPVLLLSEQSLHTQNIRTNNGKVSMMVQMPKNGQESVSHLRTFP